MKYVALVDHPDTTAAFDICLIGVYDKLEDAIEACRENFNECRKEYYESTGRDEESPDIFDGKSETWNNYEENRVVGQFCDSNWFIITE